MKKILIHSLSHQNGLMFNPDDRDNCMEPNIFLRDRLMELGYQLYTADDHSLENCEWVIFVDVPSCLDPYRGFRGKKRYFKQRIWGKPKLRNLYQECIDAGMNEKIALILQEGKAVCPINWGNTYHKMFPVIFTWDDDLVDGQKYHWKPAVSQPASYPEIPEVLFAKKNF